MKKYCKALINICIAVIFTLITIFLLPRIAVFFMPFVVGWIISLIASPMVRFFEEKLKIKRKAGSAVVIVLVIGFVIIILYFIGAWLANQLIGFINDVPELLTKFEKSLNSNSSQLGTIYERLPIGVQNSVSGISEKMSEYAGSIIGRISEPTINAVGSFAKRVPTIIIGIIMALLSSYCFVADRHSINDWFINNMPTSVKERYEVLNRCLVKSIGGYLKAQLKIEFWIYFLVVAGLIILQVDYAFAIGLVIAFFDFLPFFGTGTVMVPWALIEVLNGNYPMAIGLLITWAVGQLVRQTIQPKILGESIGVKPIPTLFLLFIGYRLWGVLGMIIAVPIGLIISTLNEEGMFDNTKNSIKIIINGINRFREFDDKDLKELEIEGHAASEGKEENIGD